MTDNVLPLQARIVPTSDVSQLQFARQELQRFLAAGGISQAVAEGPAWVIELRVEATLPAGAFAVRRERRGADIHVTLAGHDATCVLHAAYTMLEGAGWRFEISGPVLPAGLAMDRLAEGDTLITPAVLRRGIRQHINFVMDISSYRLEGAKEYMRNLARMRFNHITFHSYTNFWFEAALEDKPILAGGFFYGVRYDIPADGIVRQHIRDNQRVFCIPEIEPAYDDPREKSRLAVAWLAELIAESKRLGFGVQFSFEPRNTPMASSLKICDAILQQYPQIDELEIITNETGGWGAPSPVDDVRQAIAKYFGQAVAMEPAVAKFIIEGQRDMAAYFADLGHNIQLVNELQKHWRGRRAPKVSCGIYCGVQPYLQLSVMLMRRFLPAGADFAILSGHGSRRVANNIAIAGLTTEDWRRTMVYSWLEFDGLMYLQQNAVQGIRRVLEGVRDTAGLGNLGGIAFNHWRTAENCTVARYAAEATIEGPIDERAFYLRYAAALGVGAPEAYAQAMAEIDEADWRATEDMPNAGFCAGWGANDMAQLVWQSPSNAAKVRARYETALDLLRQCAAGTQSAAGRAYLATLDNRIRCTILYVRAIEKGAELVPLCQGRTAEQFTPAERNQIAAICEHACANLDAYMKLHATLLPDRGSEGTLISLHYYTAAFFRRLRKNWGGVGEDVPVRATGEDPPLPIMVQ